MHIKTKLLIPMIIITILVAAAILISNAVLFSDYVDEETVNQVNAAAAVAESNLELLKTQAEIASKYISENNIVINALADDNRGELLEQATKLQNETGVAFCTITDSGGVVVLRTHEPENYGDSLASQTNVQSAMAGKNLTAVETGTAVRLSVRSGSPIFDNNGDIIGVVSVGFRLDTEQFVDSVKELAACESTVFLGDERISTTVLNEDGTYAIGTKADSHISEIVLGGSSYTGPADILGRPAVAHYAPLTDADGDVIGMLFVGHYADEVTNIIGSFVQSGFVITLALLALSSAAILFILRRIVTPIRAMVDAASGLASGNFNFNFNLNDKGSAATKDEVVLLERSFADVVNVVNALVRHLNRVGKAINRDGDIEARVDVSRFDGAYREVVENVNKTFDGIINDVLTILSCLTELGSGNFDTDIPPLPGKKAVLNEAVNSMRDNLISVNKDMESLVKGAIAGNLSNRVELSRYKGDWADLMGDMNRLMAVVAEPIGEAANVMHLAAEGNFEHRMLGRYDGDFLVIKESINTTVTNIDSYIDEISRVLTGLSNNNLNQEITREYVGSFSNIKQALGGIIENLNKVLMDIGSSADQVTAGVAQISENSMSLASGAAEQASSVEELNAKVITINENIRRNAESAQEAETLSIQSKTNAALGNDDMTHMLESMEGIKDSSGKITKVIKVIEDIAFQTSLLALNAAVEAARAGEYGKGFAVVAAEVRTLADRSQTAAKETAGLIEDAVNKVNEGSRMAEQTANALNAIIDDVSKVAGIITNIAAATNEQAGDINQVSEGLSQITQVVQNNSAMSEEMAAAAQELSSQAEVMRNLVGVFALKP